jgi:hypothetical protein
VNADGSVVFAIYMELKLAILPLLALAQKENTVMVGGPCESVIRDTYACDGNIFLVCSNEGDRSNDEC